MCPEKNSSSHLIKIFGFSHQDELQANRQQLLLDGADKHTKSETWQTLEVFGPF